MSSPKRLGRYLVATALPTIWTLACAVAHITQLIEDSRDRCREARRLVVQLRLPFAETDHRLWLGTFSLLIRGRSVLHSFPCGISTPPLRWSLPDWHAPPWHIHSQQLLANP